MAGAPSAGNSRLSGRMSTGVEVRPAVIVRFGLVFLFNVIKTIGFLNDLHRSLNLSKIISSAGHHHHSPDVFASTHHSGPPAAFRA
jgi:hypothetical protein